MIKDKSQRANRIPEDIWKKSLFLKREEQHGNETKSANGVVFSMDRDTSKKGFKETEQERKCTGVTEEVTAMKKKSFPEEEAQMLEGG